MSIDQAIKKLASLRKEAKEKGIPPKEEVVELIKELCRKEGDQFTDYMLKKAAIESDDFDPTANNQAGSGAAGIYQIIRSNSVKEWKVNPDFNPYDAEDNIRWTIKFTKQNAEYLKDNGYSVTPINLYILHQQGPQGGLEILKGVDKGLSIDDLSSTVKSNIGAQFNFRTREIPSYLNTCEDFVNFFDKKLNKQKTDQIAKNDWTKSKNLITSIKPNSI